jgi:hypothetical protein
MLVRENERAAVKAAVKEAKLGRERRARAQPASNEVRILPFQTRTRERLSTRASIALDPDLLPSATRVQTYHHPTVPCCARALHTPLQPIDRAAFAGCGATNAQHGQQNTACTVDSDRQKERCRTGHFWASDPERAKVALGFIGSLFRIERTIADSPRKKKEPTSRVVAVHRRRSTAHSQQHERARAYVARSCADERAR